MSRKRSVIWVIIARYVRKALSWSHILHRWICHILRVVTRVLYRTRVLHRIRPVPRSIRYGIRYASTVVSAIITHGLYWIEEVLGTTRRIWMDEMLVFERGRRRVMIRKRICHVAHVQGSGRSIASGNRIARVRRVGWISRRCELACELARGGDICNIKPSHQRICPPQIWIQNRRRTIVRFLYRLGKY